MKRVPFKSNSINVGVFKSKNENGTINKMCLNFYNSSLTIRYNPISNYINQSNYVNEIYKSIKSDQIIKLLYKSNYINEITCFHLRRQLDNVGLLCIFIFVSVNI